jgi:hypothetical protein
MPLLDLQVTRCTWRGCWSPAGVALKLLHFYCRQSPEAPPIRMVEPSTALERRMTEQAKIAQENASSSSSSSSTAAAAAAVPDDALVELEGLAEAEESQVTSISTRAALHRVPSFNAKL